MGYIKTKIREGDNGGSWLKHKSIIDFFRDLKEIFDNNGIDCWLIYGALLGMVREGELLEWDRDIDIAVWDKSLPNIECALNEFHNKKIKVHFTESGHVTFNRDGEHISAMIFSNIGDKAVRSTFTNVRKFKRTSDGIKHFKGLDKTTQMLKYMRWILTNPRYVGDHPKFISGNIQTVMLDFSYAMPKLRILLRKIVEIILSSGCDYFIEEIPAQYFLNLSEIEFYGFKVKVPSDKEGYLEHKYGKDWRVPKKDYVYYKDSKAERVST